jgi:hypothetical protein
MPRAEAEHLRRAYAEGYAEGERLAAAACDAREAAAAPTWGA